MFKGNAAVAIIKSINTVNEVANITIEQIDAAFSFAAESAPNSSAKAQNNPNDQGGMQ
jgi:hypothetical protein